MSLELDNVTFAFEFQPKRQFRCLTDPEMSGNLEKWGIGPKTSTVLQAYNFDHIFRRGMIGDFVVSLFNDPQFQAHFKIGDGKGSLVDMPTTPTTQQKQKETAEEEDTTKRTGTGSFTNVKYTPLNCTATSLSMFDAFYEQPHAMVSKSTDNTAKMMDVYLPGGITVSDELRGYFMLTEGESQFAEVEGIVSDSDKKELLYHIMWRVLSGGAVCQFEEKFEPYKNFVRDFYKDCVNVTRNSASGDTEVQSVAFQIEAVEGLDLFSKCDERGNCNYLYLVINPLAREVIVWYNAFWSPF